MIVATNTETRLELNASRVSMGKYALVCCILAFAFYALSWTPIPSRLGLALLQILAWSGVVVFGIHAFGWLRRIFLLNPHVVIDETGIHDCRLGLRLLWQDIIWLRIRNRHILVIKSDRAFELLNSLTPWQRFWTRLFGEFAGADIGIRIGGLKPNAGVVLMYLSTYHPRLLRLTAE